jgi:hypothetical protein
MSNTVSRQPDVAEIAYYPAFPGSRAIFMAEVANRKEMRRIQELFDQVGAIAEVVPVSHGTVMSYAVHVHGEPSLFGKIEWLLKTEFGFSVAERNFSAVTLQLIASLCEESETEMLDLPQCGICDAIEPFPSRATVELTDTEELEQTCYCGRCTATHAHERPERMVKNLIRHDQRRFRVTAATKVTLLPEIVEDLPLAV